MTDDLSDNLRDLLGQMRPVREDLPAWQARVELALEAIAAACARPTKTPAQHIAEIVPRAEALPGQVTELVGDPYFSDRRDYVFDLVPADQGRCQDCEHVTLGSAPRCERLNTEIMDPRKSRCPGYRQVVPD